MREFRKPALCKWAHIQEQRAGRLYAAGKPAKPGPLPKFLQPAPKPLPKPQAKMGLMSKVDELAPEATSRLRISSDWVRAEESAAVEYMQSQRDIALGRKSVGPPVTSTFSHCGRGGLRGRSGSKVQDDELGN